MWLFVWILVVCAGLSTVCGQVTWSIAKDELSLNIVEEGTGAESLRPVSSLDDNITVNIDLNIASINDFDDANGFMDISGYLEVEWTSQVLLPSTHNIIELIKHTLIWKPPILFVNALRQSEEIGSDSETKIRFNFMTQHCVWRPWFVLRGACSPNVKYYPYDQQECSFQFAAWGYTTSEVIFKPKLSEMSFNFFEENGAWSVDSSSAYSTVINNISVAVFKIQVSRRPLYHVINLLCPVILLGILNVFVFLLPVDSGERVGFTVTCFLAYVVLLNTIMAYLPVSSLPISYLSYYTFVMMVFSAAMSLATIITVRLHHKPAQSLVPSSLQTFIKILKCACCRRKSSTGNVIKVEPVQDDKVVAMTTWDDELPLVSSVDHDKETSDVDTEVSWREVSRALDWFFMLAFLGGQVFYSVAYLIPIFTRS